MEDQKVPRIRTDLAFLPVVHDRETVMMIRDPLGLVEEGKAVPRSLYDIMVHLNGLNTVRDLQMILMRQQGGLFVGSDEIERILFHLDESYLMDSEKYRQARETIISRFSSLATRPCVHCGRSYPDDPSNLKKRLDDILDRDRVPPDETKKPMKALVAPHIDLSVGSTVYGAAYRKLVDRSPARVVILGIGHQMGSGLFSITPKDYDTPLGPVKTDGEAVKELCARAGTLLAENDFDHRAEHSIEFQVIFLKHLLKDRPFTLVPILCGSLQGNLDPCTREGFTKRAEAFLKSLREILQDGSRETLLVAGVDLSHIGPKFGHDMPASHLAREAESHDRKILQALCAWDADAFWRESLDEGDRYNVCGFSAMACLLEILPPSQGELLAYKIWHEAPTQSAVSFAALSFS